MTDKFKEIMGKLEKALKSPVKVMGGVVRDNDGVPLPFIPSRVEVQGDRIVFSVPSFLPHNEYIKQNPEVSVSIVDVNSLATPDPVGFQMKGLAEPSGGNFSLEIFEVYDVIPRAGVDLNVPIFRKKLLWMKTSFKKRFEKPKSSTGFPQSVYAKVSQFVDSTRQNLPSLVCTVDTETGVPNLSPRWIIQASPEGWFFGDSTKHKTRRNVEKPSPVSIMVFELGGARAVVGIGWTEDKQDALLKQRTYEFWKSKNFDVQPQTLNIFHFEELYEVSSFRFEKIGESRPRSAWLRLI